MTKHPPIPAEQVQKAAASLRSVLPEYNALLSFYEQLFIAQEISMLQVSLDPIVIAPALLDVKRRERLPLVEVAQFVFDASAGQELLVKVCRIIQGSDNEMASSAERIAAAMTGENEVESLFRHLLEGDDAFFNDAAGRVGCEKNALAFVAYNSLKPSLAICAQQLATYLIDRTEWKSGICPVCGNLPAIAELDPEGRRFMYCSFCWHPWPVPRVFCPFCNNTDGKMLSYLYSETEKTLRVDCCEKCRKYIKVVDARTADRTIYPPLEQVASLHLDIRAREAGFDSGMALPLPND